MVLERLSWSVTHPNRASFHLLTVARRGSRHGGSRKQRKITVLDCDNCRRPSSTTCKQQAHEHGTVNFNNLITVPLLPSDQQNKCKSLIIAQFDPRSVGQAEKRTTINDFILDNDVDIVCFTESWLNPSGDEAKCADLAPPGYKISPFPVPHVEAAMPLLCATLCVLA